MKKLILFALVISLAGCASQPRMEKVLDRLMDDGCKVQSVQVGAKGGYKVVTDCPGSEF